MKRVVLAYSGGVITSAAIAWLARQQAEVVTVTLDVGQEQELAVVRERALALGAVRAHVVDAREELVSDYMLPALHAGALRHGYALSRLLVAHRLVEIARMERASAVAHGGEWGSASEAALHTAVQSLDPALEVLAPARGWSLSRAELAASAREHGVHVPAADRYRIDASLWGRMVTAGPGQPVPDRAWTLTRSPEECPGGAARLDIEFAAGLPVRANGVEMSMTELIESLETIAGAHGVGRSRIGESMVEAPAATVLDTAHGALETSVGGTDLARLKEQFSRSYVDAMVSGRWFSDVRAAIDAFCGIMQPRVTGTVSLELHNGRCHVLDHDSRTAGGVRAGSARQSKVVA